MNIKELDAILIKAMENACEDIIGTALANGDTFKSENDITNYILNHSKKDVHICMQEMWQLYNGSEVNREVVEVALSGNTAYELSDIIKGYCDSIIGAFLEDWTAKTFDAIKNKFKGETDMMTKENSVIMTPKKLYELAKAKGLENKPIAVSYECSDTWYSFDSIEASENNCGYNEINDMIEILISD